MSLENTAGTMTFMFGGTYIEGDTPLQSVELPDDLLDEDQFWVMVQDGGFTKAIQVEIHDLEGEDFSLRVTEAKYDDYEVFDTLNGDFEAVQDHFDSTGNPQLIATHSDAGGYGLHSVTIAGVSNGDAYIQPDAATVFDADGIPDVEPDPVPDPDTDPDVDPDAPATGLGVGGTMTFMFGGSYIEGDTPLQSVELPDDLLDGEQFWVMVQDGGFTKAIQVEIHDLEGEDFSLRVTEAKYDDYEVFDTLNGDFEAVQDHFDSTGNPQLIATHPDAGGYGLHSVTIAGVSNGDAYIQPDAATVFDADGIPDVEPDPVPDPDTDPDVDPDAPATGLGVGGTMTFMFGGSYIEGDTPLQSVELPDDLLDGEQFWVMVQDGGFTKAIQVEIHDLEGEDFSLRVTEAKYDDYEVFDTLNGDFEAVQDHFDSTGNPQLIATHSDAGGYGLHSVTIAGVSNGDAYIQPRCGDGL